MNRKRLILFLFASALFVWLPDAPATVSAISPSIIISEIQIEGKDSAGKTVADDEFIELYNTGSSDQILTNWELRRKTQGDTSSRGTLFHKFESGLTIPAGGYLLWTNKDSDADFIDLFDVQSKNKTSPNLTDDNSLGLYNNTSALIDSVAWGSGHKSPFSGSALYPDNPPGNKSLTRNIETLVLSLSDKPSPTNSYGETYSPKPEPPPDPIPLPDPTPPAIASTIRINEIFPNPKAKSDSGEFIELYNFGSADADLSGWTLRDATKTGKYTFPSGTSLKASEYLVITDQAFKLSLNNTNETLSLFDTTEALIHTVSYAKTKENVSLNFIPSGWPASNAVGVAPAGWRGGTPTPGSANVLNNLPETSEKVPEKGSKNIPLSFRAKGGDSDNDTLKYAWDFGDGHKSSRAAPTHTYEKNGTYIVTLKTTDGKDDVTETFTVKIRSYDPPKVRITALSPNPAGSDTDNEWLSIENREKKTVNLKGFSIATGKKKLANHPIREDFFIPPKQTATLTRSAALFTLPNQQGKIELRAPNGEVLQKIKYRMETTIAEDTVYTKEKGSHWVWQKKQTKVGSLQPTEENSLPTASGMDEMDQEDNAPEEAISKEKISPATEEIPEQKVLGTTVSRADDTDKKLWQFLSAGTRVQISDSVSLNPDALPREPSPAPLKEHYAVSLVKTSLLEINTELNALVDILQ